jgi:hypothetical protein
MGFFFFCLIREHMDTTTTIIALLSGAGAAAALYGGLRTPQKPAPVPPPPDDDAANDRYGLAPAPNRPGHLSPEDPDLAEPLDRAENLLDDQHSEAKPRRRAARRAGGHRAPGWGKTGARDLVIGLGLLAASIVPLLVLERPVYGLPVTGVLAWIGLVLVRRGAARQHGLAVERKARRSLKLPADWTIDESVPVQGRGDADLVLTDPEGTRFVVEIKSNTGIQVRKSWFSRDVEVRAADGSKLHRDPLKQVTALAGILHGYPVVWFPSARAASILRVGNPEVIVVLGNSRQLRKAVGAGGWFF